MRIVIGGLVVAALVAATGCDGGMKQKSKSSVGAAEPVAQQPRMAPKATAAPTAAPNVDDGPAPGMARQQANPALTAKGKYELNLVTQPISAYFAIRDQVVFVVQIPKAMQYFELAKQRKPATHEEFMQEIIEKNRIELPSLPLTHRYVYDPKKGELLVEHPAGL